jgi:hypothetical protein
LMLPIPAVLWQSSSRFVSWACSSNLNSNFQVRLRFEHMRFRNSILFCFQTKSLFMRNISSFWSLREGEEGNEELRC